MYHSFSSASWRTAPLVVRKSITNFWTRSFARCPSSSSDGLVQKLHDFLMMVLTQNSSSLYWSVHHPITFSLLSNLTMQSNRSVKNYGFSCDLFLHLQACTPVWVGPPSGVHNEIHNIKKPSDILLSQVFQVVVKINQRAEVWQRACYCILDQSHN